MINNSPVLTIYMMGDITSCAHYRMENIITKNYSLLDNAED